MSTVMSTLGRQLNRTRMIAVLGLGLLAQHVQAHIFNGYEEWYASLPQRVFAGDGEALPVSARHSVRIDGRTYRLLRAKAFPGENVYRDDLGRMATLYRSTGYYCIQGAGATSGTASRHVSVYLVERRHGQIRKLPSLFASCLGIGHGVDGAVSFLQARIINYRAAYDADGVAFSHHLLVNGSFATTPDRLEVRFVEPGNFYRFEPGP
ncbi:hypothetical protein [Herbaspirillum robiniae]|uniref:hypothetical protein n=1 Tax=Herbaspirillum robiniae TaxID=2014887 RepID=UPI003D77E1A3